MREKPIGIFDSGIGGLTVVKEILKVLPNESLIYLGDTARVPYGPRGKEVITKFALELTRFLLAKDIKFLVVACNTISAICLEEVKEVSPVPVLGVIDGAVKKAVSESRSKRIGVIGTRATVNSRVYEKAIKELGPAAEVFSKACPLFVPLAEEGLISHEATRIIAKEYLSEIIENGVDTLILGCTHYLILREIIQETVGVGVTIVDSAFPTAEELKRIIQEQDLLNTQGRPNYQFFVTDAPRRVKEVATDFLGRSLPGSLIKTTL